MTSFPCVNGRYNYIGDDHKRTLQEIEAHHILVQKSTATSCILFISILSLIANSCYLLSKDKTGALIRLMILLFVIFVKYWKSIEKESVVIMPGFGVQLEIHFKCGRRVVQRFVPIEHILKPVLKECVTPVTCYWNLGLIVHGGTELMLVFQELRPPVNMLVGVWKALCSATHSKEVIDTVMEDDQL